MCKIKDGKEKLKQGYTFAALGKEIYISTERGIKPIVELLRNKPDALKDAVVCDKVIGKAAALLLAYGEIKELYTPVLSRPAEAILKKYHIQYQYDRLVDRIKNRAGDGLCPMETMAMDLQTAEEAFAVFSEKI